MLTHLKQLLFVKKKAIEKCHLSLLEQDEDEDEDEKDKEDEKKRGIIFFLILNSSHKI